MAIAVLAQLTIRQLLDRKADLAAVDIGRQHRHAQPAALGHALGYILDLAGRCRQHRRHILGRVIGLQPGSLVREQPVERGVRPVERVAGKGLDEIPQRIGLILGQSLLEAAFLEARLLGRHHLPVLLTDRLQHDIRVAERVAGDRLEQLHNLLLVHDHAVSVLQDRLKNRMDVLDLARMVLAMDVCRNLLQRARPVQRHHGIQVVHPRRLELHQVAGHARAFKLEHICGLAAP